MEAASLKYHQQLQADTMQESVSISENVLECSKSKCIPCQLDKISDGRFLSLKDAKLCKVGCDVASTIVARYYKGIAGNHDNMVITKE